MNYIKLLWQTYKLKQEQIKTFSHYTHSFQQKFFSLTVKTVASIPATASLLANCFAVIPQLI